MSLRFYESLTSQFHRAMYCARGGALFGGHPMTREIEVALALIFIVISGFCLWEFSYVTGAITATAAQAFAIGLYIHSERKRA